MNIEQQVIDNTKEITSLKERQTNSESLIQHVRGNLKNFDNTTSVALNDSKIDNIKINNKLDNLTKVVDRIELSIEESRIEKINVESKKIERRKTVITRLFVTVCGALTLGIGYEMLKFIGGKIIN
jgi:hypothetical protein